MKLPFGLSQFADFFSDESIADAEVHLSEGRIGSLTELEKKLWIWSVTVDLEDVYFGKIFAN